MLVEHGITLDGSLTLLLRCSILLRTDNITIYLKNTFGIGSTGATECLESCFDYHNVKMLELLLTYGAELNPYLSNRERWHKICISDSYQLAKLMLQYEPNLLDDYSLVLVVLNNSYQVLKLFVECGADLTIFNQPDIMERIIVNLKLSVGSVYSSEKNIVQFLCEHGVDNDKFFQWLLEDDVKTEYVDIDVEFDEEI